MYDFQNDVLICLVKLPIFQDKEIPDKLSIESVVFLWMVLMCRSFQLMFACFGVSDLLYIFMALYDCLFILYRLKDTFVFI